MGWATPASEQGHMRMRRGCDPDAPRKKGRSRGRAAAERIIMERAPRDYNSIWPAITERLARYRAAVRPLSCQRWGRYHSTAAGPLTHSGSPAMLPAARPLSCQRFARYRTAARPPSHNGSPALLPAARPLSPSGSPACLDPLIACPRSPAACPRSHRGSPASASGLPAARPLSYQRFARYLASGSPAMSGSPASAAAARPLS